MEKSIQIHESTISEKIFLLRGKKVMLDSDLAVLYQVETKVLNQAVKRNIQRFPEDFMIELTEEEWKNLKSQNVTSSHGGRRTLPYAFTEQGIAMLASVLRSDVAIQVNIQIVRVFVRLREMMASEAALLDRLERLEARMDGNDEQISEVFEYLRRMIGAPSEKERKRIGFRVG